MARSKGEGGITRLEDKPKANCRLWRLKAVDWGGKTRYRRFHGTYSQAEAAMRRFKAELASPMSDETFGAYSQRWLDRRRRGGEISGQTLSENEVELRRLRMEFGDLPLCAIDRARVVDGLASIKGGANPSGRTLSGTTMSKTFATMRMVMREAAMDGLIGSNPLDLVRPPKRDTPEKQALPFDQVRRALAMLESLPLDAHTVAVRLMLLAGLRRSEAVGLEWRDVRGGMVFVSRSVAERTGEVKEPKTAAGVRAVPMLPQLASSLEAWKVAQASQLSLIGIEQAPETPVVTSAVGTRMRAQNLARWWKRHMSEIGVDCRPHELRHTFLTMLANSGASAASLRSIAGWSSIEMASVYVHDDMEANAAAVGMLGSRFSSGTLGGTRCGTFSDARNVPQSTEEYRETPGQMSKDVRIVP